MYLILLLPIAAALICGIWRLLGRTQLTGGVRFALAAVLGATLTALLLWSVLAGTILLWQWNDPIHM